MASVVFYRHALPSSFPLIHFFTDREDGARKVFILRHWCLAVDMAGE